jgi:hypothetical protein
MGQAILEEEGCRRDASSLALRQLVCRWGSLDAPTSLRIEILSLPQLEELAMSLLDFGAPFSAPMCHCCVWSDGRPSAPSNAAAFHPYARTW